MRLSPLRRLQARQVLSRVLAVTAVVVSVLASPRVSAALTINLVTDNGPFRFGSNGWRDLIAAKSYWEQAIPFNYTTQLYVHYADLGSGAAAITNHLTVSYSPDPRTGPPPVQLPTSAEIRVDTLHTPFFKDRHPWNNSIYNMTVKNGHWGQVKPESASVNPPNGGATPGQGVDLVTVLCHEIGHALGFYTAYTPYDSNVIAWQGPPDYYHFAWNAVGSEGRSVHTQFTYEYLPIMRYTPPPTFDPDFSHLDPSATVPFSLQYALMQQYSFIGKRILPTPIDVDVVVDACRIPSPWFNDNYSPNITAVSESGKMDGVRLYQNTPNPCTRGATISFELQAAQAVHLAMYDASGRHVRTLIDGRMPQGRSLVRWNGCADDGRRLSSGVYFYRLSAGEVSRERKLVLLQ